MHSMVKGGLLLALLSAGATALLSAQQGGNRNDTASVISKVIQYRMQWMRDSTRFDACSVFRSLGEPSNFPEGIEPQVRGRLDRTTAPCGLPLPENDRVGIVSVRMDDTAAVVRAQVVKGEQAHIEEFKLRAARGRPWGVLEVRLSSHMTFVLVRPAGAP